MSVYPHRLDPIDCVDIKSLIMSSEIRLIRADMEMSVLCNLIFSLYVITGFVNPDPS